MDLKALIARLMADGTLTQIGNNPAAAYTDGRARIYVGASILPERDTENNFTDSGIRFRTVIANDGMRYSPAQLKVDEGLVGSVKVEVGHSDIARQFTGRDYDLFLELLNTRPEMDALVQLLDWTDVTVGRALRDLDEKQRWQALVVGQVIRQGDNGYQELVQYPNPTGHRVTIAGAWSDDTYDPIPDLLAGQAQLASKGYVANRLIGSRKVAGILGRNAKVRQRATSTLSVSTSGQIQGRPPTQLAAPALNAVLQAEGLPPLEVYDELYRDYNGSHRFYQDDAVTMTAATGRDQRIAEVNLQTTGTFDVITDTLGYTAVGRPVGVATSQRVIRMWPFDDKPPRIHAEGWQATIPVVTEPEALWVGTGIH